VSSNQFNRNHTRPSSEQSGFELGGEHSSGGGPYTRRIGPLRRRGVLCRAHRQAGLLLRLYAGCGERIAVIYRTVGRAVGRAVNTANQLALAAAGSPSVSTLDRLSNQSPGAHLQRNCRSAAQVMAQAAASTECTVERHLQGEPQQLFERCVAGRCAASQRAFDEPERRSGGAHSEGDVQPKALPDWWNMRSRLLTTGRRLGDQNQRHCAGECVAAGAGDPTVLANLTHLTVTALNAAR